MKFTKLTYVTAIILCAALAGPAWLMRKPSPTIRDRLITA